MGTISDRTILYCLCKKRRGTPSLRALGITSVLVRAVPNTRADTLPSQLLDSSERPLFGQLAVNCECPLLAYSVEKLEIVEALNI
jgi:hypothetical protein